MTTAREIMHAGVETVTDTDTLTQAAHRMRDLDIGALPVCDSKVIRSESSPIATSS